MGQNRIKVLIAEGNALLAEALEDIFRELDRGAVMERATNTAEALAIAIRDRPDLIVLDAWMARSQPEITVRRLLECSPGSTLVVMATSVDSDFARRMREAGAAHTVEKDGLATTARSILAAVAAR